VESARRLAADLRVRIDELLVDATGLFQARMIDARARVVAMERDLGDIGDVKGEAVSERLISARDRGAELVSRLKFAALQVQPPPPPEIHTLVEISIELFADTFDLAQTHGRPTTFTVAYVTEVPRVDFDALRDRLAALGHDVNRFSAGTAGDLRNQMEITLNILASSQRDLRVVVDDRGVFLVDRLESVSDRVAEVRDRLADASGHFNDEPQAKLGSMRAEAERLHEELRAILEGRTLGGPGAEVKEQRDRVTSLNEELSPLLAKSQGAAVDHLEDARASLVKLHTDLGSVIGEKGEFDTAKLADARISLSQAKTHLVDAKSGLEGDARTHVDHVAVELDKVDADLAAMAKTASDSPVRAATRPVDAPK
jgi:hypothetical protein